MDDPRKDETQLQRHATLVLHSSSGAMSTPKRFLCDQPGCGKTYSTYGSWHVHRSSYHRRRTNRPATSRSQGLGLAIPRYDITTISDLIKRASGVYSALVNWHHEMDVVIASIVEQVKRIVQYFRVREGEDQMCIGKSCVASYGEGFDACDADTWNIGSIQARSYSYGTFILCALLCISDERVPAALRENHVDRHVWACAWERAVKAACERDPILEKLMDKSKAEAGGGNITRTGSYPVIYVAIPRGLINGVSPMNNEVPESQGVEFVIDATKKPPSARRNDAVLDVMRHAQ